MVSSGSHSYCPMKRWPVHATVTSPPMASVISAARAALSDRPGPIAVRHGVRHPPPVDLVGRRERRYPARGQSSADDRGKRRRPHAPVVLDGALNVRIKPALHDGKDRVRRDGPHLPDRSRVGLVVHHDVALRPGLHQGALEARHRPVGRVRGALAVKPPEHAVHLPGTPRDGSGGVRDCLPPRNARHHPVERPCGCLHRTRLHRLHHDIDAPAVRQRHGGRGLEFVIGGGLGPREARHYGAAHPGERRHHAGMRGAQTAHVERAAERVEKRTLGTVHIQGACDADAGLADFGES